MNNREYQVGEPVLFIRNIQNNFDVVAGIIADKRYIKKNDKYQYIIFYTSEIDKTKISISLNNSNTVFKLYETNDAKKMADKMNHLGDK